MPTDAHTVQRSFSDPMPPCDAPADDLKRWMAGRLGLLGRPQRGGDTTTREAHGLWCAIVDSMVWQRERQGASLDISRFVLALRLPDLRRRADDGDVVLAAYLSRVAGGSEGQAAIYRARHGYLASFLVGELVAEIEHVCRAAAASPLLQGVARRGAARWRTVGLAALCTAVGAGLGAFAIVGPPSIIGVIFGGGGSF